MLQSLRSRLWLTYALIIGVVLVVVVAAMVLVLARGNFAARLQLTQAVSQLFSRQEIPLLREGNYGQAVARIDENLGMRTLVIDSNGLVLADSHTGESALFPDFTRIPRNPLRDTFFIQDDDGRGWLYTGRPLQDENILLVATPRQPLREVIASPVTSELLQALAQAGAIALGLSLLFAYLVSRWVAAPLQGMARAAQAVADGRRAEVVLEGPQEVRALGEAFNAMADQVHFTQKSQRDFIANISHELKTPLTSIQGFAQAILDKTASSPAAIEKSAQVIFDESGRMNRLVLDLLDLARLDAGTADLQRAGLDLEELLRSVAERLLPQSDQAEVRLVTKIERLPAFTGDGDRLAQVFTNLVDNALKHTPSGGRVTLGARQLEDWIEIAVADSGEGIPPEELSRIFERFYQLDKARQGGPGHGLGLGLAIANEIVIAHGGNLSARSKIGEGSVFIIRLPVASPDDSTLVSRRHRVK